MPWAIIGIGIGIAVAIAVAIGFCRPAQPIATAIPIPTDMVFSSLFDTAKCQPTYELIGISFQNAKLKAGKMKNGMLPFRRQG